MRYHCSRHVAAIQFSLGWGVLLLMLLNNGHNGRAAAWIPSQSSVRCGISTRRRMTLIKPIHFTKAMTAAAITETMAYNYDASSGTRSSIGRCVRSRLIRGRLFSKDDGELEDDPFVDLIDGKTADEIEKESYRRREARDLPGLKRLSAVMKTVIEKKPIEDTGAFYEANGIIRLQMNVVEQEIAKAEENETDRSRVAGITVGLDESLKHGIDLQEFERRVFALFRWHDGGEMNNYMAPYLPIIQSSGTGKTRLFMALREVAKTSSNANYDCMTVLCSPEIVQEVENSDEYFDQTLRIQDRINDSDEEKVSQRLRTRNQLQVFLSKSSKDKLVLLFDEAQHLLHDKDGAVFRCVRWWLREQRKEHVVAVFAGTTSKLANFYRDTAPSGFSRNPGTVYANWEISRDEQPTKLYDPFFRICTVGCFQKDAPQYGSSSLLSDFERAAFYGRPLFAYLQKTNLLLSRSQMRPTKSGIEIASSTLHGILNRMLMTDRGWRDNKAAVCSILGSRVQMGVTTSLAISSDLVSKGYAHLVHFTPNETNDLSRAVARVSFMPDPVCAALAMGMMNENWIVTSEDGTKRISGQSKLFWSNQAMSLLASGLCLPEKGNAGEIMGALYMLYCGDVMRFSKDKSLHTFSIPLLDWYRMMRTANNNERLSQSSKRLDEQSYLEPLGKSDYVMDVNFIQVCRNYFRAHSWKTQKAMELMYMSACASYVYPDCKAIDLVASVRVLRDGKPSYHPLLVSVKCSVEMSQSKIKKAVKKMKNLIYSLRTTDETEDQKDSADNGDDEDGDEDEEDYEDDEEGGDYDDEDGKKESTSQKETSQTLESTNNIPNFETCPPALCLLFLIGAQKQPDLQKKPRQKRGKPDTFDYKGLDRLDLGSFPNEDTFRMITVPKNDLFDVSLAVSDMTSVHEMTEIFSSHGFVYGETAMVGNRSQVLRKTRSGKQPDEPTTFVNSLIDEFFN